MGNPLKPEEIEYLKKVIEKERESAVAIYKILFVSSFFLCFLVIGLLFGLVLHFPINRVIIIWIFSSFLVGIVWSIGAFIRMREHIRVMKDAIARNDDSEVFFILKGVPPHKLDIRKGYIRFIEEKLRISLPDFYKNTILGYPFPEKSIAANQFLTLNPYILIANNAPGVLYRIIDQGYTPFYIGKDLDEKLFFIDLSNHYDRVYSFDQGTGEVRVFSDSWEEYLGKIKEFMREIDEEMKEMENNLQKGGG